MKSASTLQICLGIFAFCVGLCGNVLWLEDYQHYSAAIWTGVTFVTAGVSGIKAYRLPKKRTGQIAVALGVNFVTLPAATLLFCQAANNFCAFLKGLRQRRATEKWLELQVHGKRGPSIYVGAVDMLLVIVSLLEIVTVAYCISYLQRHLVEREDDRLVYLLNGPQLSLPPPPPDITTEALSAHVSTPTNQHHQRHKENTDVDLPCDYTITQTSF